MTEQEANATRKTFASFVQEQRGGSLHGELSDALASLVTACDEHRKPGTLMLTIKVAPNSDGVTVTVTDKIAVKAPEGERGAALFFIDADGNLMRRDPRQTVLPIQEVPRVASAEAGA